MKAAKKRWFPRVLMCLVTAQVAWLSCFCASKLGSAAEPGLRYTSQRRLAREVTLCELSNGLTVIVQENHVAPVATVRCYVKNTGSMNEGRWMGAGLSHVLEHVVAGGSTTKRGEKEIERIINSFGGATNAFTSNDMTAFHIDCPARNITMAIELVADSMQHVTFVPEEFDRELKVVKQELADGEVNRSRVLFSMLHQTVYAVHPARHPVIGYLDVLEATKNETITGFYRERYVPSNQVFVVVGDVDTPAVLAEVARQWSGTPRRYETTISLPAEPEQLSPREAVREMEGSSYDMILAWPTVPLSHDDMPAVDVAANILGEGESSRLAIRLKYQQPLVLSITAASYTPEYVRGWFGVIAVSQPEHWRKAEQGILAEAYRLRDELVGQAELEKAKNQKAAERVFGSQTVQQAADDLGRNYIATHDPLFEDRYVESIRKVTAEQIRDVARRYFVPERLNRVLIAPPGGAPKPTAAAQGAAGAKVQLVRLPNGLRVLVKPHRNLPMVNIQAFVAAGALADTPETAGRSRLVAAMLDQGTPNRSATHIAEFFDSIGGQSAMSAGRNTVYGSASVLSKDFPQAMEVFADCFLHPTFPEKEFERQQQLALGAIARRSANPQQEIMELFYDSLPAASPYHIVEGGKQDTVRRLRADDLRAYHRRYFVPNNMIVSVFGDVDAAQAIALVEKHFGGLKPDAKLERPSFERDNAIGKSAVRHKKTAKDTAMVMFGYRGTSIFQKEDQAAMTMLDAILSGYEHPGGWLHTELRGAGLVYFVDAMPITGPAPGFFAVIAQTRPDKVDEVMARIRKNIERMKAGQFTPDEFATAKQMVLAMHAQGNTTIAAQARQAALDELYGLGYQYDRTFDSRIEAVQPADVIRVAKTYLAENILVTASPEDRK